MTVIETPDVEDEANVSAGPTVTFDDIVDDTPEVPDTHNVGAADTLDTIADFYAVDRDDLYHWNAGELDRQAAARGFSDSEGGRHLFPGGHVYLKPTNERAGVPVAAPSNANEIARMHALFVQDVLTESEWLDTKAKLLAK